MMLLIHDPLSMLTHSDHCLGSTATANYMNMPGGSTSPLPLRPRRRR